VKIYILWREEGLYDDYRRINIDAHVSKLRAEDAVRAKNQEVWKGQDVHYGVDELEVNEVIFGL
jgi:hypothetical protein